MARGFIMSVPLNHLFVTLLSEIYDMTQATERDYWISPNAFYIELNAMGLPDYIQASCVSGAKILVYIKDIISYDAGHNYKRWTLQASPTVFNTHTAKYVYAAVPRSDDGTKNAFIVFPSEELDVYGKNVAGQQIGSEEYYYVFLQGIITSSGDNGTENRDWQQRVSSGLLASDEAISATGTETEWYKYSSVDGIVTFLKNLTMKVGTLFRNLFVETLTIVSGGKIAFENQGEIEGIADNSTSVSSTNRIVTPKFLDDNTLSSVSDDTAQGLITFAKGLISEMLAQLKGGATFGKSGYKFDKDGNVVVDALSSLTFDEALERGFGITKNTQGKYTLSVTDLMVWGKAVFNSLEIRKLYAVGGNVYLSGASSKLQHVSPVTDADGEVTGWKCYILGDDGTTATQNGWVRYDQAKCQTFDIKEGVYENVSNTYYWRLVTDVSTENETITETYTDADGKEQTRDLYDGKKFGWVILSKTDCESAGNDAPKAGDTIVLDGHRMFASGDTEGRDQYNDESRTNVMMLETTGTEDGTLPRIVALTGIVDYRHWDCVNQYSNTVFILSPKEVVFVSSSFKFMSASGDPITLVNFRGNWAEDTEYRYYDQVSHGNAIWTCIVKKGDKTTAEPSDTSKDWRKEISGGKDGKDGKSARRTAVVNLTSDRGTVFNGSYVNVLLRCSVVIDGKSMGGRIPRDNFSWTRDGQKILPDEGYRYRLVSSSDALDLWKCSVKIPTRLLEPIELTALRADGNSLIFHASEDVSKMTLYLCRKRYCRISKLNINRNAWGFRNMVRDYPIPLPFTSLGDNNYSVDMSQLLSSVESHNIVLHKTAKVTTGKTALKHGKHTYWLKQGADGKYHAWGRYGVWLANSNFTPVSTVAKCKIYVETDSDTSTTGTASLSV